jgi:Mce-associated membrane protein
MAGNGFIVFVKQAQTKSLGAVSEAAIESEGDQRAQVLVAVSVKTANLGADGDQKQTSWRVRITLQNVADVAKVSDAQFVT